ncbi:MAG: ATP-binding cassette domain-containing protein, partial [Alcaligenaceae bacterium]
PTTALDVTTQRQILLLIKELQKTHNTAVLFVTHDFGVVAEIADRIAVMKQGKLVELGTRQEILTAPKDPYTKLLIAAVPSLVPPTLPEPTGSPILVVDALCKIFIERRLFKPVRTVNAVQDARFVLRPKEVLGIVGESGSGKSTLARCIARLIEPSSGSVKIDGIEVAQATRREFKPLRRRIQIVFQDPYRSLNGRLRVGDSLVEGMRNFGFTRAAARVRAIELLQTVGLEADVMQRYPHQFSGGQRQRICIARALAPSPDILIADEAVSALDVSVQAQVLALLNDIRLQTNIAVIFITHDLRVAAQICNNLIVMQAGQMVEIGQAQTILTKPRHAYTQELLDAAPGRHWDFQNFCALS